MTISGTTFRVVDSDVRDLLDGLGDKAGNVLELAVRAAAEPVKAEMKTNAPRSTAQHQHAADSIETRLLEHRRDFVSVGIGPDKKHFYIAAFIEYGTRFMAAMPFMRRALADQEVVAAERFAAVEARELGI